MYVYMVTIPFIFSIIDYCSHEKNFCDAPFMFNVIELLLGICSTSNICMVA